MYASDDVHVAARFIRRDIFLSLGGFDTKLVAGEDYDLHNRILAEYPIGKIEPKEMHLGEPKSLSEIARKHYYYGKTINAFLHKNKDRGLKQVSPIRAAYTSNLTQFIHHPVITVGFIVYQLVRYTSGILGLVVAMLKRQDSQISA